MKKFMKMAFAVVAFAAVGLGSYKAYGSYTAANMSEEDLLIAENVLAISEGGDNQILGWLNEHHDYSYYIGDSLVQTSEKYGVSYYYNFSSIQEAKDAGYKWSSGHVHYHMECDVDLETLPQY